jgi:hypothetical protein
MAIEKLFKIILGLTNIITTNKILVKYLQVELVLASFIQGESEGLVPDRVVVVVDDSSLLLVFLINP